jgi:hypothetical protein
MAGEQAERPKATAQGAHLRLIDVPARELGKSRAFRGDVGLAHAANPR